MCDCLFCLKLMWHACSCAFSFCLGIQVWVSLNVRALFQELLMEVSGQWEAWYSTASCGTIQLFIVFPSGTPCGLHSLKSWFSVYHIRVLLHYGPESNLSLNRCPLPGHHSALQTQCAAFPFDGGVTAAAEARILAWWQLCMSWHSCVDSLCQVWDFLSANGCVQGE